jgi:C_GCAxxG_C_C family probable redox protein
MRASCGLGAGAGRLREVCGAVSGMAVLAGLKHSGGTPDAEAKKKTYEVAQAMAEAFRKRNGSVVCRELLGLGRTGNAPVPSGRTEAHHKKRPCAALVGDAAALVEEFLTQRS